MSESLWTTEDLAAVARIAPVAVERMRAFGLIEAQEVDGKNLYTLGGMLAVLIASNLLRRNVPIAELKPLTRFASALSAERIEEAAEADESLFYAGLDAPPRIVAQGEEVEFAMTQAWCFELALADAKAILDKATFALCERYWEGAEHGRN